MKSSTDSNSTIAWQTERASKPKKIRSDSRLKMLPLERQKEIRDHLQTHSLADTASWLKSTGFNTSIRALSIFLSDPLDADSRILLDVVIESNLPVRFIARKQAGQIKFEILKMEEAIK